MVKKTDIPADSAIGAIIAPMKKFSSDSYNLVQRCTKPTLNEFKKIATVTTIGFLVMGIIGFGIKLVHIPINTILVGQSS